MARLVVFACLVITLCRDVQTASEQTKTDQTPTRPNILLAIADDWSWPHAGASGADVHD